MSSQLHFAAIISIRSIQSLEYYTHFIDGLLLSHILLYMKARQNRIILLSIPVFDQF